MSRFQKDNEDIENLLAPLSSLTFDQFCQRWVPLLYRVSARDSAYSQYCIELISKITQRTPKTVRNWYYKSQNVPDDIEKFLGAVDALWRIRYAIEKILPNSQPEKPE